MSLTGTWKSTFGTLKLIENGNRVHGLYRDLGVIEAIKEENTNRIIGTFSNTGNSGTLRFAFKADKEFAGTWRWGDQKPPRPTWNDDSSPYEWEGEKTSRKIETETKAGEHWEGTWDSSFGTLHFHQNGSRVYGLYRDLGIIEGQRVADSNEIKGRFTNTGREGWFSFKISSDGSKFSGEYGWRANKKQGEWNGTLRGTPTSASNTNGYVLKRVNAPYAPGHTELQLKVEAKGRPSGHPDVVLHVAHSKHALQHNPIEIRNLRTTRDHKQFYTKLPVADPDLSLKRSQPPQGQLICGQNVYAKIMIKTGHSVTDIREFDFKLPDPVVLVNIGDSYGSGVGTGHYDLKLDSESTEKAKEAKRSSQSGQHRAMTNFARNMPCIIINTAFSGNRLNSDLIQNNGKEGWQLKAVNDELEKWTKKALLSEKRVDYLIISAGGNDMHEDALTGVATRLFKSVFDPAHSVFFKKMRNNITSNLSKFRQDLRHLHNYLNTTPAYKDTKVLYCTYPDSTRDEHGKHTNPPSIAIPGLNRPSLMQAHDFAFAYEYIIKPLNDHIRDFWKLAPNRYIKNDVEPVSRLHGYPSEDSYFVRLRFTEGNLIRAAFHPSRRGHEKIYFNTIKTQLKPTTKAANYSGGNGQQVTHRPISHRAV